MLSSEPRTQYRQLTLYLRPNLLTRHSRLSRPRKASRYAPGKVLSLDSVSNLPQPVEQIMTAASNATTLSKLPIFLARPIDT